MNAPSDAAALRALGSLLANEPVPSTLVAAVLEELHGLGIADALHRLWRGTVALDLCDSPLQLSLPTDDIGVSTTLRAATIRVLARHAETAGEPEGSQLHPHALHLAGSSDDTALALATASLSRRLGQPEAALSLLERIHASSVRARGEGAPPTLQLALALAEITPDAERGLTLATTAAAGLAALHGDPHPDALRAEVLRGERTLGTGSALQAIAVLEPLPARIEQALGVHHALASRADRAQADALFDLARPSEAMAVLKGRLTLLEQRAPGGLESWRVAHRLALAHAQLGDHEQALELAGTATATLTHRLGPDHDHAIAAAIDLATCLRLAGRPERSAAALEQVLQRTPGHLAAQLEAARSDRAMGRLEPAGQRATRLIDRASEALGPHHRTTLGAQLLLAQLHLSRANAAAALPLFARVAEGLSRNLGPLHPTTTGLAIPQAEAQHLAGHHRVALQLLTRAEKASRATGAGEPPPMFTSLQGRVHAALGHADKARPLLETALRRSVLEQGELHPHTLHTRMALAEVLAGTVPRMALSHLRALERALEQLPAEAMGPLRKRLANLRNQARREL